MRLRSVRHAALLAAACLLPAAGAEACGADTDCSVDGGVYRIAMPALAPGEEPAGAVLFFHGWQGTAAGVMRNSALISALNDRKVAVVAPQGMGKSWSFPSSPSQQRDDFAFVGAVLDDVEDRFGIDPRRTMASGFSLGGSMVWYLACRMSDRFAGFAPVAGAFWDPIPKACDAPTPDIIHVHGTADRTVPMAGRPIGERWHQGDVYESLSRLTENVACPVEKFEPVGETMTCRTLSPCDGRLVELCLHPGGHSLRSEWVVRAWEAIAVHRGLIEG